MKGFVLMTFPRENRKRNPATSSCDEGLLIPEYLQEDQLG